MYKRASLLVTTLSCVVAVTAFAKSPVSRERHDPTMRAASTITAAEFTKKAGSAGLAEVQLSEMAIKKSDNPAVKSFAQMMIDDHSKANEQLTTLANGKNLTVPATIDADHRAAASKLRSKSGRAFDLAYVAQMVRDHTKAVELFSKASAQASDDDFREFATQTLPTLKHHKEEAEALNQQIGTLGRQSRR